METLRSFIVRSLWLHGGGCGRNGTPVSEWGVAERSSWIFSMMHGIRWQFPLGTPTNIQWLPLDAIWPIRASMRMNCGGYASCLAWACAAAFSMKSKMVAWESDDGVGHIGADIEVMDGVVQYFDPLFMFACRNDVGECADSAWVMDNADLIARWDAGFNHYAHRNIGGVLSGFIAHRAIADWPWETRGALAWGAENLSSIFGRCDAEDDSAHARPEADSDPSPVAEPDELSAHDAVQHQVLHVRESAQP